MLPPFSCRTSDARLTKSGSMSSLTADLMMVGGRPRPFFFTSAPASSSAFASRQLRWPRRRWTGKHRHWDLLAQLLDVETQMHGTPLPRTRGRHQELKRFWRLLAPWLPGGRIQNHNRTSSSLLRSITRGRRKPTTGAFHWSARTCSPARSSSAWARSAARTPTLKSCVTA